MDCLKLHECELCERSFVCEYDKYLHNSWVRKARLDMIRKVILVNSVKGGLGTTAFATAFAADISKKGIKTALLETSFFSTLPDYLSNDASKGLEITREGILPPMSAFGFSYLSPALFMQKERRPVFWDAEAVLKFIRKMVVNTNWGDINILVMDVSSCQTGLLKEIKAFFGEKMSNAVVLVDFKDPSSTQAEAHIEHIKTVSKSVIVVKSPSHDIKVKDKLRSLPFVETLFSAGTKPSDVITSIMEPYAPVLEEVSKNCLSMF